MEKLEEVSGILCDRRIRLRVKGKVYKAVVTCKQGWGRLQKPDYDYSAHKIIDYDYSGHRVVIEKAITITIIRLQLLVYHGNDSRLFIRHVHYSIIMHD